MSVLGQTQIYRNLLCPLGTDVSELDIDDLQQIAVCTYRLEINWSQNRPRISGEIGSVPCRPIPLDGQYYAILAAIPATSHVLIEYRGWREDPATIILFDTT